MAELKELRARADRAIDQLSKVRDARDRQNQDLTERLTDLKAKYQARNEELDHYHQQIEALTRENEDLEVLADRLVQAANETLNSDDQNAALGISSLTSDFDADWLESENVDAPWPHMSNDCESAGS